MKATGIVRRIDDLGRVVVPKEIRRTFRIREGDSLEIFTGQEGEIILKKYSPMKELADFSVDYVESIARTTGYTVCVTDKEKVVAAAGNGKRQLLEREVHPKLRMAMEAREEILASLREKDYRDVVLNQEESYPFQAAAPVIRGGDVVGSVVILSKDTKKPFGESELLLVRTAAGFLGRQMEE